MRALLALCAALPLITIAPQARAAPLREGGLELDGGRAFLRSSGARIELAPTLVVTEDASGRATLPPQPGATLRIPFHFHPDPRRCADPDEPCASAVGEAATPDGALAVTIHLARPSAGEAPALSVEAVWHKRAWVHLAAIELAFPASGMSVVGRDLRPTRTRLALFGRFDPKWVTIERAGAPLLNVIGDDASDGLTATLVPGRARLLLELVSAADRPFRHDARCATNWHLPNPHLSLAARLYVPGDRVSARLTLLPGRAVPLVKSRWPDGRRAAFVITDHADQTSARTLAVLTAALERHHLVITKALFSHGADRPQLEDPAVVALADRLYHDGSEIVPHSATPHPDLRAVTSAALERFERWHARTWIDHQPETNCEAFGNEGYRIGGRYGIADLLAAHAYPYVWAEDDAPEADFNLLLPRRLGVRAPTVWPIGRLDLGGPDSLWMFRTGWDFVAASQLYKMWSPARLDELERERGLHIAHTYLETYHPPHTRFGARNLLVPKNPAVDHPGGPGPVALDPRFDAILGDLERRKERGTLWMPTLAELADRLRATAAVEVTPLAGGAIRLETPKPLSGATFVVARPNINVEADGLPLGGSFTDSGETIFWLDLPAGQTRLTLRDQSGAPLLLAAPIAAARK